SVKRLSDGGLINVFWYQFPVADLGRQGAHRIHNLGASAVVDRQAQNHAGIGFGQANVLVDFGEDTCRQALAPSDGLEADVLVHHLGALFTKVFAKQRHEKIELGARSLPVLNAEAIKRELSDAETAAFLNRRTYTAYALPVPLNPGLAALPRPAAVAVHDDGYVSWQTRRFQSSQGKALQS